MQNTICAGGWRKVNTLASAECELSVDHITITLAIPPIQWRRLGAGMQRLASAVPQLKHKRGGAYCQTKVLELCDCHQIITSSRTKRRRAVLSTVRKMWMVRSTWAGAHKRFERVVRRRRAMQRPIPYRTRGTVTRPASGHSCRPTSLQWWTRRTAFFLPQWFQPQLATALAAAIGPSSLSTLSAPSPPAAVFEI